MRLSSNERIAISCPLRDRLWQTVKNDKNIYLNFSFKMNKLTLNIVADHMNNTGGILRLVSKQWTRWISDRIVNCGKFLAETKTDEQREWIKTIYNDQNPKFFLSESSLMEIVKANNLNAAIWLKHNSPWWNQEPGGGGNCAHVLDIVCEFGTPSSFRFLSKNGYGMQIHHLYLEMKNRNRYFMDHVIISSKLAKSVGQNWYTGDFLMSAIESPHLEIFCLALMECNACPKLNPNYYIDKPQTATFLFIVAFGFELLGKFSFDSKWYNLALAWNNTETCNTINRTKHLSTIHPSISRNNAGHANLVLVHYFRIYVKEINLCSFHFKYSLESYNLTKLLPMAIHLADHHNHNR